MLARMRLGLFLRTLDVLLLADADIARVFDLLLAALGIDELFGRFAVVAIGCCCLLPRSLQRSSEVWTSGDSYSPW